VVAGELLHLLGGAVTDPKSTICGKVSHEWAERADKGNLPAVRRVRRFVVTEAGIGTLKKLARLVFGEVILIQRLSRSATGREDQLATMR
jgi:hypothetical protein